MPEILLASGSPRRRELLRLTGWPFTLAESEVAERALPGEAPIEFTRRLALEKAQLHRGLVLGADTVVVDGEQVLGKPASVSEARDTLASLRGRVHQVVTSIALVNREHATEHVETCLSQVPMREYPEVELETYLASGSPLDKAGSYGIQDDDFRPVDLEQMQDCYANVMGLPLCHLVRSMRAIGHEPPNDVPQACIAHTGYDCPVYEDILEWRV